MDDKTMLEWAARAAGIAIQRSRLDDPMCRNMLLSVDQRDEAGRAIGWNPLTDDGDALRLAVKLTLEIDIFMDGVSVRTHRGYKVLVDADECKDAYAATRRAIVRAAAEIGKAMAEKGVG